MRYGSVHSSGKIILPIGDSIGLRFMLDDFQKGNFWTRTIAGHDADAAYIYPDRRTYLKQLQDAVKGNAQEIFICIDTPINDFLGLADFTAAILVKLEELGFEKEVIISPPNEPLEHMSVTEYIFVANVIGFVTKQSDNARLSIGGMASEFTDFYRRISTEIPYYDYIDFHTSNDGNIWSMEWLIENMPPSKPLINSEHYLLNCAKTYGYNSDKCLAHMKELNDYMFARGKFHSIYVTVPSIYKENPDDRLHVLRYVDINNNVIMTTKMWYLLKLYEEGKEVMANLELLREGSKGFQALVAQNAINVATGSKLKLDGNYGPATAKAVNKFRKNLGFIENGQVTYPVWYFLLQNADTRELIADLFEILRVI